MTPSPFFSLTTKRLVLRAMLPTDAEDVLVFRGDAEVQKYNSDPLRTVEEAAAFIESLRAGQADEKEMTWAITLGDGCPVIGTAGLYFWNTFHRRAEVGYELARAHWGHGLGREAVGEVVHFGFERLNLNRIEAATIADNFQSVALLKKLGFQLEGLRRGYSWEEDGTFHDSAMYALLRHEFIARAGEGPYPG